MVNLSKLSQEARLIINKLSDCGYGEEAYLIKKLLTCLEKEINRRTRLEGVIKDQNRLIDSLHSELVKLQK